MARHTHLLGYPPSDGAVGDCLTECEDDEWAEDMYASDMSFSQSHRFLFALFKRTASVITIDLKEARSRSERITKFRKFMTDGQSMRGVGEKRRNFYKGIVNDVAVSHIYRLKSYSYISQGMDTVPSPDDVRGALKTLLRCLDHDGTQKKRRKKERVGLHITTCQASSLHLIRHICWRSL